MNKTFVIAEAGANHDRKFNQALKLVNLAVVSGCDAVKFQTYSSETLYRKNTPDFAGYKDVNNLIKEFENRLAKIPPILKNINPILAK